MSVKESTAFTSFLQVADKFLDHKATYITAFVVSVLAIIVGSLTIAQQYGGLGHTFSWLEKVPLGASMSMFGVGGFLLSFSVGKIFKNICPNKVRQENSFEDIYNNNVTIKKEVFKDGEFVPVG